VKNVVKNGLNNLYNNTMKKHIVLISLGIVNIFHGLLHIIQFIQSMFFVAYATNKHTHNEGFVEQVMHSPIFALLMGTIGIVTLVLGIRDYQHHKKCETEPHNHEHKHQEPLNILEDNNCSIVKSAFSKLDINDALNEHIKWMDEHPDYNERYGTDKSYWLGEIRAKGFNPIGITTMTCEETIILATKEEVKKAWEMFKPEGWWYSIDEWEKTRKWYVHQFCDRKETNAPKVYCLDDNYKEIIK